MDSPLQELVKRGKAQGYLAEIEIREQLSDEVIDPHQIEDIITIIEDMGVKVFRENGK